MDEPRMMTNTPTALTQEMMRAYPEAFRSRNDVLNALHHRLSSLKAIQKIQGESIASDFLLTSDGSIVTSITWLTGWSQGPNTLIIEVTGVGEYIEHTWAPVSAELVPTVMARGVIPDMPLDHRTAHLASRRWRGNHHARQNLDPANILGIVENAVKCDQEVIRTVYEGRVSYVVPLPIYGCHALIRVDTRRGVLVVATLITPWQLQRHTASHYLCRDPTRAEVY
jgi:hypothetical protein